MDKKTEEAGKMGAMQGRKEGNIFGGGFIIGLFVGAFVLSGIFKLNYQMGEIETFGPVEVRAYTPWQPNPPDWITASGHKISPDDFSVAISEELNEFAGTLRGNRIIHIPGYNKPDGWSIINDRSVMTGTDQPLLPQIEVLMTVPSKAGALERAKKWGVKKGILKRMKTKTGYVSWVEFEEER